MSDSSLSPGAGQTHFLSPGVCRAHCHRAQTHGNHARIPTTLLSWSWSWQPFHCFWVRRGWEPGLEQRNSFARLCKDTRRMMFRLLPWDRREMQICDTEWLTDAQGRGTPVSRRTWRLSPSLATQTAHFGCAVGPFCPKVLAQGWPQATATERDHLQAAALGGCCPPHLGTLMGIWGSRGI